MKRAYLIFTAAILLSACGEGDKKAETTANTGSQVNPLDLSDTSMKITSHDASPSDMNYADTSNFTSIQWIDNKDQTLPKVKEGEVIEVTFRFKNSGTKPLVVQNVTASCGCTVPEKPEKPVMPGEQGLIKAKFDSNGRPGHNTKTLTVFANTNSDKILTFSVDVEGK